MKKRKIIFLSISIIVVLAVVTAVYLIFFRSKAVYSGYQAVFLTNGQVYFGKITDANKQEIKLEDIYYLQVNKDLQNSSSSSQASKDSDIALIKLGNELHGPQDLMIVNRAQVLFTENLKDSSKVIKAINDSKNKKN